MPTTSVWNDTVDSPQFPPLSSDLHVDVAVVGGGNTGATTAYLMKQAGLRVALIEQDRCAMVDTGHTTAHLTQVTDSKLSELVERFGREHAWAVWDAGASAIDQIEQIVRAESIDCHFCRVPGFLHASLVGTRDESDSLREEARLAHEMGFISTYIESVPVYSKPGIRFPNQARMHPLMYLGGLLATLPDERCHVFEHTEATGFSDGGRKIEANGHTITADFTVIATDAPIMGSAGIVGHTLLQTKIAAYTSYAVGGMVPKGQLADALWWDTGDPYFFLRMERRADGDYVIFGGADHKTGQESDTASHFRHLVQVLRRFLPNVQIQHQWSGQVMEPVDGLPYIGEMGERQFVATGFSGNGLTFGTLAAMMARDAVVGRKNPWQPLFDVNRKKVSSLWTYLLENKDYPYYMIKDRLQAGEAVSLDTVERGRGKLVRLGGDLVAAYRDEQGAVTMLSPVCTHMGCIVHWNSSEATWDCPCHGSRFHPKGEVLAGPAETPLHPVTEPKK